MKWILMVVAAVAIMSENSAEATYVQSGPSAWVVEEDPADIESSNKVKYSIVDTDAEDWAYCHCRVYTRLWVAASDVASQRAAVTAYGTAYWNTSWEWEGPPSEPPGGTLAWGVDADGRADAWGATDPGNDGTALSEAYASASASLARDSGTFYGGAFAEGSAWCSDLGFYNGNTTGNAGFDGTPTWVSAAGAYAAFIDWTLSGSGNDSIAVGTSYVNVTGIAYCYGDALAVASYPGSQSEATTQTYAVTDAWFAATLTSN
ncbi:MAG TPA: hypothetical protein PKH24_07140 [Sedimentisphaerales bacterium]|nr:hypothetical protein [Sedimentisphaerales bacterium]